MASEKPSWRNSFALHPLRVALVIAALVFCSVGLWVWLGSNNSNERATIWYGDTFTARGFDKRTIGRALALPTRESAGQRTPSIAIMENIALPAAQIPSLEVSFLERDVGHRIALIWRNSVEPTVTQRLELEPGIALAESVRIASHRGWRGTISGIGIAGGHTNNVPLVLKYIATQPSSAAQRLESLTRPFQAALSRPAVGTESTARARRVWLAPWLALCVVFALGTLAWAGQRFAAMAPRPIWLSAAMAGGMVLIVSELTHRVAVTNSGQSSTIVRASTLAGLGPALKDAPKPAALHVWSGDARGHEIALASAPRRTHVTLGSERLPAAQFLEAGDTLVVLARRGVRFDPTAGTIAWPSASNAEPDARAPVQLISAGDGDAVFKVLAR
jgi:hypothetical protein